jgi:hypothetical protein
MGTTAKDKPVHDWTSHYRTALEYLITFILENEQSFSPAQENTQVIREIKDFIT